MKKRFTVLFLIVAMLLLSTSVFAASAANYDDWFDLDRINAIDCKTNLKKDATREEVALLIAHLCDELDCLPTKRTLSFEDNDEFKSSTEYRLIVRLSSTGIVCGYPDDTFKPEAKINRAEALAIILRSIDYLSIETESYRKYRNHFKDIEGHWAEDYIERAYELGLINGYEEDDDDDVIVFRPDKKISRQEVITILVNLMGESNNPLISSIDKVYELEFDNSYDIDEDEEDEDDDNDSRNRTERPTVSSKKYEDDEEDEDEDEKNSSVGRTSRPTRPTVSSEEDENEDDDVTTTSRPSRPTTSSDESTTSTGSTARPSRPTV